MKLLTDWTFRGNRIEVSVSYFSANKTKEEYIVISFSTQNQLSISCIEIQSRKKVAELNF